MRREARLRGAKVEILNEEDDFCLLRVTGAKGAWAEFELPSPISSEWVTALQSVSNFSDFSKDYRLLYKLATGGFSEVHVAENLSSAQQFAVKIIRKAASFTPAQVDHEISIMTSLRSEAIGTFVAKYEDANSVYIVERRVPGTDLHTYLSHSGRFSEEDTKKVTKGVLTVLRQIHEKGILHCDLKLENVMVQRSQRGFCVAIVDFGQAARLADHSSSGCPVSAGTIGYMPPEVLKGAPPTAKTDLYSVGMIAFALLTGKPPSRLQRSTTDVEGASIWRKMSPTCRAFVTNLLASKPEDRPTASEALTHNWLL